MLQTDQKTQERAYRVTGAGIACLMLLTSMLSGCGEKPATPAAVTPPAMSAALAKTNGVSPYVPQSGKIVDTKQVLADPNVPDKDKALIKAHMGGH